jgi:hypothetical protein
MRATTTLRDCAGRLQHGADGFYENREARHLGALIVDEYSLALPINADSGQRHGRAVGPPQLVARDVLGRPAGVEYARAHESGFVPRFQFWWELRENARG